MHHALDRKIHIGISACQFGARVRYNGKARDVSELLGRERGDFIWHPVCPEAASGMGVPRNPVSLRGGNGDDFWEGRADIKSRTGQNLNEWIRAGAVSCLETLNRAGVKVFIFMEGSPSCGVYRTSLKNRRLGHPPGIFGSLLLREGFFLIPAEDLQSPLRWWDWRRRMFAFVWLDAQSLTRAAEASEIWHTVKFLLQELSRVEADDIGRRLADAKSLKSGDYADIKRQILDILRRPSTTVKIKQALWKNYSYMRKHHDFQSDIIRMPTDERSITRIAEELHSLEILSAKKGLLFGASPLHYERTDRDKNNTHGKEHSKKTD